jgi:antitoxin HicB
MPDYIALVREDDDDDETVYYVSFPDLPGVVTAGDDMDEALSEAAEALTFAAEDHAAAGEPMPRPRSIEELQTDPAFREQAAGAVIASVPLRDKDDHNDENNDDDDDNEPIGD